MSMSDNRKVAFEIVYSLETQGTKYEEYKENVDMFLEDRDIHGKATTKYIKDVVYGTKRHAKQIKKQIESLEITNNKLTESLDKTYMDRLKGIIDEEQYIRVSENIKTEIDNNKKSIDNLKNEQIEPIKIDNKILEKYINEFLSIDNPTRELIINLVEKIYIYQDKTIDIIFTFNNVT